MIIIIEEDLFYSHNDEERFYAALEDNPGIKSIRAFHQGKGRRTGVELRIDPKRMTPDALRDLLALMWRYECPLPPLRVFADTKKHAWLKNKEMYWFKPMFRGARRKRR